MGILIVIAIMLAISIVTLVVLVIVVILIIVVIVILMVSQECSRFVLQIYICTCIIIQRACDVQTLLCCPYICGAAVHIFLHRELVTFEHPFVLVVHYCNTTFYSSTLTGSFAELHMQGLPRERLRSAVLTGNFSQMVSVCILGDALLDPLHHSVIQCYIVSYSVIQWSMGEIMEANK